MRQAPPKARHPLTTAALCGVLAMALCGPASAQEGSREARVRIDQVDATAPPKIRITFTELTKAGSVADKRPLAKYRLRIDGLRQEPAKSLHDRAEAKGLLNLVLLVQLSPSMGGALPEVIAGAERLMASLDQRTMAGLVAFTDVVNKTVPLSAPKKITSELKRLSLQADALTVQVADAVHEGLGLFKKVDAGQQKMLVLIGDGLTKDLDQKTFSDLGRACAEQKVLCHTIGFNPLEPNRMRTFYELSQRGRGTYRPATSTNELKKSLVQLQGELAGQLTATYELPTPADGEAFHPFDGKEHDFELSLTGTRLSDITVAKTGTAKAGGGGGGEADAQEEGGEKKEAGFWANYWWTLPVGFGVLLLLVVPLLIFKRLSAKKPARKDEMPTARRRTAYLDPDDELDDEDDEDDDGQGDGPTTVRPLNSFTNDPGDSRPGEAAPARLNQPSWVGGTGAPLDPPPGSVPAAQVPNMAAPQASSVPNMELPGQPAPPMSAPPPAAPQQAPLAPQPTPQQQAPLAPQPTPPRQAPLVDMGSPSRQTAAPVDNPAFPTGQPTPAPAKLPLAQTPGIGGSQKPGGLFNLPSPAEFMANQSTPGSHPMPGPGPAPMAPSPAPPMAAPVASPMAPMTPAPASPSTEFPVFNVPSNASFNSSPAAAGDRIQLQPGSNLEILSTDKPEMAFGGGSSGFVDRHTQILDMGQVSKDDLTAWIVPLDDPSYPTVRVRDGFMLGADASCDFIVQGEGVEGRHAVLVLTMEGYALRWAASEVADDAQLLLDNDRFRVGDREFLYKLARPFAEEPRARARLEVLDGLDQGRTLALMDSVPYAVGNHPSCALVLRGQGVGPRHAIALRKQGICFMEDLGAETGLLYNGGPVGSKGIKPGEEITLGGVRVLFALD